MSKKSLNMGLYTALKSLYTSKDANENCNFNCTTEKPREIRTDSCPPIVI